jgi:hypothetical protein
MSCGQIYTVLGDTMAYENESVVLRANSSQALQASGAGRRGHQYRQAQSDADIDHGEGVPQEIATGRLPPPSSHRRNIAYRAKERLN